MPVFAGKTLATALFVGLVATLPAVSPAFAQVTDYLGIPGPIPFEGTDFELAWSSNPEPHYIKQEYVPQGQTPEAYEQMVLIETVTGAEVMDAVRAQVDMLEQRRASDPLVNMDLIENQATGEVLLDFLVSTRDEQGEYIVEWNAYRYVTLSTVSDEPGVLLFAISLRAYGNDNSVAFMEALPQQRSASINALATAQVPHPAN